MDSFASHTVKIDGTSFCFADKESLKWFSWSVRERKRCSRIVKLPGTKLIIIFFPLIFP